MIRSFTSIIAVFVLALLLLPHSAVAQITTGTVTGRVVDSTGGVVPNARVILISEARGTRTAPINTNETGDYVLPNVAPDTYTVEVSAAAFKTTRVTGIVVTGGDRVGVPALTLEVGQTAESVTVTAEAALVQTQSGERSYAIETKQVEALPVTHGNFASLVAFTPGVNGADTTSAGGTRLGGASQNNIMMDGISTMDTGNNGQMLQMNVESISEVKVLTQGYQAEYGRASGLQITAVTKSGSNDLHGGFYALLNDSDWNNNSWVNTKNGDPKSKSDSQIYGYTVGGPVFIPKVINGKNKLFFFYAHEYRPTTSQTNGGSPIRLRVPSALERAGDYSQSRDQNGNLLTSIIDSTTGKPFPGLVIPTDRLYAPGVRVLGRYPLPNLTQLPGTNYNYQMAPVSYTNLTQQPAVRIDYQATGKLRLTGKYSGQRARQLLTPGTIPGFNDTYNPYPYITNMGTTVTYMVSPTMFVEGTYGFIKNQLGAPPFSPSANAAKELPDLPMLYPNAGVFDQRYYAYQVMQDIKPPFWDGKSANVPPTFSWGNRIGAAPPNQSYPSYININRTQDMAGSLSKVTGRHTFKFGIYNNHSYKAQNVLQAGYGGGSAASFQRNLDFSNDTNNSLDSGFGYANAALGVFTRFSQASKLIEGDMTYNNTEGYLQDNWKVTTRLTLDYGVRLTRQQPQSDKFGQMTNFFPGKFDWSQKQVLYIAGCKSGAVVCSGSDRNAMDPRTGQILVVAGAKNTAAAIGTPVPGLGNQLNGIRKAGDGISKYGYEWPTLVIGPRFGFAYDLTGNSKTVLRGGFGLFYDRPDGNTVFSVVGNPPAATAQDLLNGDLATVGQGGWMIQPVSSLVIFQYKAKIPSSWQWQAGIQRSLPGGMVADVTYVGNHGYNLLGGFQGVNREELNGVDFGKAYLAQYQDPTLGTSTIPGKTAYTTNLLRPFPGLGTIGQHTTEFWDTYHSLQFSVNRRFAHGFSFGANYTYGISLKGNTGITRRFQHAADGTPTLRSDEAAYEKLMETLDVKPHLLKANGIWTSPNIAGHGAVLRELIRDWQISGILTAQSGNAYNLGYSYTNDGANVNITGSTDWAGRMVILDPTKLGSGCSDNQYGQFSASAVRGPGYGSLSMESGRNYMRGCFTKNVDMSVIRRIRIPGLGESRRIELRADLYNAFNLVNINGRSATATFDNPTSMTLTNNQYNADGSLNQNRLTPRNAGFGAATGAAAMRTIQLQARFQF